MEEPVSKRSFGHEVGVKCSHCKTASLFVRTKQYDPNGDRFDGGSFYPVQTLVDELFCSKCFAKFVAFDEGKDIRDILEEQLPTFVLPITALDAEQKVCRECGSDQLKTTHSKHWSDKHARTSADVDIKYKDERYHFVYCEDCLTVAHIRQRPQEANVKRHL